MPDSNDPTSSPVDAAPVSTAPVSTAPACTAPHNAYTSKRARNYALGLLTVVYAFNFIDRQLLAIFVSGSRILCHSFQTNRLKIERNLAINSSRAGRLLLDHIKDDNFRRSVERDVATQHFVKCHTQTVLVAGRVRLGPRRRRQRGH